MNIKGRRWMGGMIVAGVCAFPQILFGASISISPERPLQGEPLSITVSATTSVQSIYFDSKKLSTFTYKGNPTAFYGIDLYKKSGTSTVKVIFTDGRTITKEVFITARKKEEAPLGIPQKLGGNTAASATKLVDTLALENAGLLNLRTGTKTFWTEKFGYPVTNPIVTDHYGYQRQTGQYSIAHKGTDFRAKEGVEILAMNRGVVRVAREGRNYGKTIVVDHGLGVQTFYMHLSKINVNVGELVQKGQVIGLSGGTGYADQPHLHLTVRINDVSIDPIKFLELFMIK